MTAESNNAMDRTRRSAGSRVFQSSVSGALLLVGHLERWARMRSRNSNSVITVLALLMSIALPIAADSVAGVDSSRSDMEQLQGKWKLVYQKMDGKKLPDEQQAQMFHGTMIVAGDKIHYSVELQFFDFEFSYRLHPDQHPKGIDLTLTKTPDGKGVGQTMLGIYRLDEGTLEICHSRTNRPTDFTAGEGSHHVLIVLKRADPQ
jgi:uncharacterized protein (TIGR03067 family)